MREKPRGIKKLWYREAWWLSGYVMSMGFARSRNQMYQRLGLDQRTCYTETLQGICWLLSAFLLLAGTVDTAEEVKVVTSLERPQHGEASTTQRLRFETSEESGEVRIRVPAKTYTETEIMADRDALRQLLMHTLLGENRVDCITRPVHFVTELTSYPVEVRWRYDPNCFTATGMPKRLYGQTVSTDITASIHLPSGRSLEETFSVVLAPGEELSQYLVDAVTEEQDHLSLPESVAEIPVKFYPFSTKRGEKLFYLGLFVTGIFMMQRRCKISKQYERRQSSLLTDYVDVLQLLLLYMETGCGVTQAFLQVTAEYESRKGVLQKELLACQRSLSTGRGISESFSDFAKACGMKEYRRLGQMLTQHARSGTQSIVTLLQQEVSQAQQERLMRAKRLAKKAETKLLFPLLLMLVVVFLLLIAPALLQMKG